MTKYELNIELTKKGLKNYSRVVEIVFQFANLLKSNGPIINLCNELNCIGKLRYDYPDRSNPLKSCIKFAEKLHKMPEKDISQLIRHSYLKMYYDPRLMAQLSNMLCKSERVMIFIQSK